MSPDPAPHRPALPAVPPPPPAVPPRAEPPPPPGAPPPHSSAPEPIAVRPSPPPSAPASDGHPIVAALLLVALGWALVIVLMAARATTPVERVTDEIRSRLDVPSAQATPTEPPPTAGPPLARPSPSCTEVQVTDEYGQDVAIRSCGQPSPAPGASPP